MPVLVRDRDAAMGESSESSARPTTLAEARERLAEARAAVRRNEGLGSGRSGEGAGDDLASKVETVRRAVAAMNSGEALADVRERKVGSARTHSGTADADQGSPSKAVGVAVEQLQSIKPTVVSAAQKRLSTLSTPFSPRRVLSAEPRAAQAWQPPASPKSSPASQRRASGVNQNSRTPSFTPSSREREQRREREADTQRGGAVRPKTAAAVPLHSGSGGGSSGIRATSAPSSRTRTVSQGPPTGTSAGRRTTANGHVSVCARGQVAGISPSPATGNAGACLSAAPTAKDRVVVTVRKRPCKGEEEDVVRMRAAGEGRGGLVDVAEPRSKVDLTRYTFV